MSDEEMFNDPEMDAYGRQIEEQLWAEYSAAKTMRRFERGFKIAVGALLAIIFGFNAWLVWLIWWR